MLSFPEVLYRRLLTLLTYLIYLLSYIDNLPLFLEPLKDITTYSFMAPLSCNAPPAYFEARRGDYQSTRLAEEDQKTDKKEASATTEDSPSPLLESPLPRLHFLQKLLPRQVLGKFLKEDR